MENVDIRKLAKYCRYGHLILIIAMALFALLVAVSIAVAGMYVAGAVPDADPEDPLQIEFAMGAVISVMMMAICFELDRIVVNIRNGESPFTEDTSRRLIHMTIVMIAGAITEIIVQAVMMYSLDVSGYTFEVPVKEAVSAMILYALALIFRYGTKLQKESDETL